MIKRLTLLTVAAYGFSPTWLMAQDNAQEAAKGFVEDAEWQVLNRMFYERRDFENGARNARARNSKYPDRSQRSDVAEEWGYGLMGTFTSGFTQGRIGFGLDAQLYQAQALDTGGGRAGAIRALPLDRDGYPLDNLTRGGAALKLQAASTRLRYGEQRVSTPIFSASDSRLLPETHTGWYLESDDISVLKLQAGYFTGSADRYSRSNNNPLVVNYASNANGQLGNAFRFLGGRYSGMPGLSLSLFTGELEDTWRTHYLGSTYRLPLGDTRSLTSDLHLYRSRNTGQALAGAVDTTTGSLLLTYRSGYHSLGLGYQYVAGDTPFDYVTRGAIWLTNSMQMSDFNAPNERSWQLNYAYDLSGLGLPGLSTTAAYVRGSGTDGSHADPNGSYAGFYGQGGRHWERDLSLKYVVQDGSSKNLSLQLRHSLHRANSAQGENDAQQLKLVLQYPLSGRL